MDSYAARLNPLEILDQNQVWVGTEYLTAIARLFKCIIQTFWENGPITAVHGLDVSSHRVIRIVYRQHRNTWNHYDSFAAYTIDGLSACAPPLPITGMTSATISLSPSRDLIDLTMDDVQPPNVNFPVLSQSLTTSYLPFMSS